MVLGRGSFLWARHTLRDTVHTPRHPRTRKIGRKYKVIVVQLPGRDPLGPNALFPCFPLGIPIKRGLDLGWRFQNPDWIGNSQLGTQPWSLMWFFKKPLQIKWWDLVSLGKAILDFEKKSPLVRPLIMVDDNLHSIPFYYRSRLFSATRWPNFN